MMKQDKSHVGEAMEAVKSRIPGLASSFGAAQQVGLEVS